MTDVLCWSFGGGKADGHAGMRDLLGGKGAGLAEMTRLGLPVPPGFTIATSACLQWLRMGTEPEGFDAAVDAAVRRLEGECGRRFGDTELPLLVSVRSGSRASMPGMMDTILNLGLTNATVAGVARGGARFAWDSYRRFIQMYANVVLELDHDAFEHALEAAKRRAGVTADTGLDAAALEALVQEYKGLVATMSGSAFPDDPREQLRGAIRAVFRSWNNARAVHYRKLESIPDDWGTAVTVQAMVFGNMGDDCATGVCFTRDPSTGERRFFGEYLANAQGEDVVAGIRTPLPILGAAPETMESAFPEAFTELQRLRQLLETHYRDMQDIEFTVERGRLFLLQTRNGKRTAAASVRIAVDMVGEGLITRREALLRVQPKHIEGLLHPRLDPDARPMVLATGIPGSPGAASGALVFTAEDAVAWSEQGKATILMRPETSPEDIVGMTAARGIVTARGGATSHAAVVARGMGKTCVVGCTALEIDVARGIVRIGGRELRRGDVVTLDGSEGRVLLGAVATIPPHLGEDFHTLLAWADEVRRLGVRANADTPEDARVARSFGAQGIGLCRTEHMFFDATRITAMREMILATSADERRVALAKLLPMQEADFVGILREQQGFPVTIRLLDPPLHEFLPHTPAEMEPIAHDLGVSVEAIAARVEGLRESNPMLGHRGVRLLVTYPEIAEMQAEAIIRAACRLLREEGIRVEPEIMIPLVGLSKELEFARKHVVLAADRVLAAEGVTLKYTVGTMIELPRAALMADRIAAFAEFFSFGTNDLTQTTFGLSRDDASRFMPAYVERGIFPVDPFATLDAAVEQLIEMATLKGRAQKPGLKVGICGEHGGDPASVAFCHRVGLDYVSCSPYRVPVARLAAAQAALAG